MARRKNDGIVGRILLWFVGAFVIIGTVAGIKFVIEKDFGGSEEPSQIVPIPSETPPTSDGGATSDEPSISEPDEPGTSTEPDTSEEPPSSSEEPEPEPTDYLESVAVKGPFDHTGHWMSSVLSFESDTNITPLNQASYRNSDDHGKLQHKNREYIFNSAKMGKGYEGNSLSVQLGFPTTLNDTHDEKFGLNQLTKRYTSYLIFDYKVKNDTGFKIDPDYSMFYNKEEVLFVENSDMHLIYKTNESPNWNYVSLTDGEIIIPADDLFYQFALVLNTGNKQNNVVIGYFDLRTIVPDEPIEQPLDPQPEGIMAIEFMDGMKLTINDSYNLNDSNVVDVELRKEYSFVLFDFAIGNTAYFTILPFSDYQFSLGLAGQDIYLLAVDENGEDLFEISLQFGHNTLSVDSHEEDISFSVVNRPFYASDFD